MARQPVILSQKSSLPGEISTFRLRSPSRCLAVWWARRRWRIDSTDACYRLSISKSRTLRRLNSHGLR